MKLSFDRFGKPQEVLNIIDSTNSDLFPYQVRIKFLAAPINPADINFIEGTYGIKPFLPTIPGMEGIAEITESSVIHLPIGQRVIFLSHAQSWQTECVVNEDELLIVPHNIDPLQLAMLKVNPATALRLLTGFRKLSPGNWIVQNAANSGVGRCVIQLAREVGIQTINFVRDISLIEELEYLGAGAVFSDDEEGHKEATEFTYYHKPKLAFNAVGGESSFRLASLLDNESIHITYGAMGKRPVTIPNKFLIFQDIQFRGLWLTKWLDNAPHEEVKNAYRFLIEMVRQGKLTQPIDQVFSLSKYHDAFDRLNHPHRKGKVMFSMIKS
jgi:mitochondrial enoyl-[acyl-carrier protein] reductase / trans-2-enoyl-CoA reductase